MARIPVESASATEIVVEGKRLASFGGCNYLGLAHHTEVLDAVRAGLDRYGLSTTASRETTGDTMAHELLEAELAGFLQTQQCLVTPEGYSANLALGQALARDYRVAITDEKCHRSVSHAVAAAGMRVIAYPHLDTRAAGALAGEYVREGVVILTDGVFAADGSIAPAKALFDVLPKGRSLLVIDDCHGFCVLGRSGRGTADHHGLSGAGMPLDSRVLITTSLAKGLGCYGGALAGPSSIVQLAQDVASVYRGTTPAPPAIVEGARAALKIVQRDPILMQKLRANTDRLRRGLAKLGISLYPTPAPIFTFVTGDTASMDRIHRRLIDAGFLAPLIAYPGGPTDRYFRVTVNAMHTSEQIDGLLAAFAGAMDSEPTLKSDGENEAKPLKISDGQSGGRELIGPWDFSLSPTLTPRLPALPS
ncbi:MAG: pyridoxal phosphate-dependent aminotransferase family protein [Phycisphaeraceae bacterium]|nr:pyridoxal phosphate-dependent aminotransferase family protein [Phycisphaeraceae bacterium]